MIERDLCHASFTGLEVRVEVPFYAVVALAILAVDPASLSFAILEETCTIVSRGHSAKKKELLMI